MLLNPPIAALVLVSLVVSMTLLVAAVFALQLLMRWDIASGSEAQLTLERRTYLISVIATWSFASELVALLLFVHNAEAMSGQFVGAMCATGVLNVNPWGWPTLLLKILVFFGGAVWLVINNLDNKGYDYPLIRVKYLLLLMLVPLIFAETYVQLRFFLELNPDVITSCCGSLFSADAQGVAAELSGLHPALSVPLFYGSGLITLLSAIWYLKRGRGGWIFAIAAGVTFAAGLAGVVSYVALYIYEHPHHHCPFCILKQGHGYVGYALYFPLFVATATALASGVIGVWKNVPSLSKAVAQDTSRLTRLSMMLFMLFFTVATLAVFRSNLTMDSIWW